MGASPSPEDRISTPLWEPGTPYRESLLPARQRKRVTSPNANPEVFRVTKCEDIGRIAVCEVFYPDATDFGGQKILVFQDRGSAWAIDSRRLDPNFEEGGPLIARFMPDEEGWQNAILFAAAKNAYLEAQEG